MEETKVVDNKSEQTKSSSAKKNKKSKTPAIITKPTENDAKRKKNSQNFSFV